MCCRGMSYLPLLLVLLTATTFIVTYIIAIAKHDVSPDFPYISDTGTKPPESCIFSLFLNMCAALCLCTIYVRYKLVEVLGDTTEDTKLRRLNKLGLGLGILTALGLSLVANFQETNVEAVHLTGAALVFGVGVVYALIQTSLTYHMEPEFNGKYICRVRLTLTIISALVMVMTIASATVSRMQKDSKTDKLHWKPDEPGFAAHIASTVGEWITALVFLFYFLTFVRDFMRLKIDVRPQIYVRHLDEEPTYPGEYTRLLA
ncbi:DNA damage-regulated autophagy modulator protein 2-like [Mercenaria mercenaria]|uniref:DNA damage-regulated autophagy modulator protein 2-like n=1 Tax=Mercenaria mercenaria TaxID=6596 RepID=UPI001E1DFA16|nr:DNA damage-regulated autophagy modulator protein 2-like [Mercenaria mercenaria]XP_045174996.1 DNA damage-regulated autophagy modulator protein 2-like [Mercenaria mercenaria]XP_045174998.1 DNA damage-regulated autophagy modulator protein 2-like [Mercenaria mercenaria]